MTADADWYAARRRLWRGGQALDKAEHDALTANLGRPLTGDPIKLRPGHIAPAATPTTQPKDN